MVPDDRIEQGSDHGERFGGSVEALREFVREPFSVEYRCRLDADRSAVGN
jgi:hypothetical protein